MLRSFARVFVLCAGLLGVSLLHSGTAMANDARPDYAFAIHGGAGTIERAYLTEKLEAEYREKLLEALTAGQNILADGGSSIDAVIAAIVILEDSPLFNAGKGAVFTNAGKNELDASIMDGRTLNSGAVAGVTRIKNPILLARSVMDNSEHVMMQGKGAEKFARRHGFKLVSNRYFYTERRWLQLQHALEQKTGALQDHDAEKFGTVGAVALDKAGNLAAGTSTGGRTNKLYGRVGDSPIIGAGNYASNASCAVSGTGHGEYFIRATVARDVCAMMEYAGVSLEEAANTVVFERMGNIGGTGGVIAVDKDGNIAMPFNTSGMYRAAVTPGGEPAVAIFQE